MSPARRPLRAALLTTGAAGVLAVPVTGTLLAQSPLEAAAAPRPAAPPLADHAAHLAPLHRAVDAAVAAQMTVAGERLAAEQAAAAQAAAERAAAERAAAERAAAERAAAERAAAERAAAERAVAERAAAERAAAAAPRASRSSRSAAPAPAAASSSGDPRSVARALLAARGEADQFGCLDRLWSKESGWSTTADNPTSSAYGIPQALPGSKMASAGADWQTSARTQITWGLGYIESRYGSPCAAWSHSQANNWY